MYYIIFFWETCVGTYLSVFRFILLFTINTSFSNTHTHTHKQSNKQTNKHTDHIHKGVYKGAPNFDPLCFFDWNAKKSFCFFAFSPLKKTSHFTINIKRV